MTLILLFLILFNLPETCTTSCCSRSASCVAFLTVSSSCARSVRLVSSVFLLKAKISMYFIRVLWLVQKLVRLVFSVGRRSPLRLVKLVFQVSSFKACKFGVFLANFPCYSDLVATCTTSFPSHNVGYWCWHWCQTPRFLWLESVVQLLAPESGSLLLNLAPACGSWLVAVCWNS